jgi:hypothetical protein
VPEQEQKDKPTPKRTSTVDERPRVGYDIYIIGGNLMRGSTRIGLLAISVVCMFAVMVASAFADADDQMLDSKGSATFLRDVSSATPKKTPDALGVRQQR